MILTNRRYPPRLLIKEIRDELVIRENIEPDRFREMIEGNILDYWELILDNIEIDIREGVEWSYNILDNLVHEEIVEYHLDLKSDYDCLTIEISDRIRLVGWRSTRYEVLSEHKSITDPSITLLMGQSGAIRRLVVEREKYGKWMGSQDIAAKLETVRTKRSQLLLKGGKSGLLNNYQFSDNIGVGDEIIIFDGLVDRLRAAYNSPALDDVQVYKRQIIAEENIRNRQRLTEINDTISDPEYRDALISRLKMEKRQFVEALKSRIRELEKDQDKLDDQNRFWLMSKYHGPSSYIDDGVKAEILGTLRSLSILSRLSGIRVYVLFDMSRAFYYNEGIVLDYTHVSAAEKMIDEVRNSLPEMKEIYVTDDLKDRYRLRVITDRVIELDVSSSYR